MKEDGLGRLFVRHLVMAVPWGIMLLVVFFIAEIGIKQQVKEGVQYGIRSAIFEVGQFANAYKIVMPVKKNLKEGIEFAGETARKEIKALLNDPQVKQDLKEALEYAGEKLRQ
ncbi:MAG: hypothetical protein ABIL06_21605 [Pseudomonadota bacterium]